MGGEDFGGAPRRRLGGPAKRGGFQGEERCPRLERWGTNALQKASRKGEKGWGGP